MTLASHAQIIGVDGCRAGWIAVIVRCANFNEAEVRVFRSFAGILAHAPAQSLIAADMPIGLPERTIKGGREPDWAAREFLRPHQVRIFPVPSRRAVYACGEGFAQVCAVSRETSDPPRAPSKQLFGILPRIQEIDLCLRKFPALRERVFEVHPEVSFKVMNDNEPLASKKVKGRLNLPGIELRKELLAKEGFSLSFLDQKPPRGSGLDDFYDACACAWSANRIAHGKARVFPASPPLDREGIVQAIWA